MSESVDVAIGRADRAGMVPEFFPPVDLERLPRVLAALREVAAAVGTSVARVALAWQLTATAPWRSTTGYSP